MRIEGSLTELRNPLGLFQDHARVVGIYRAGGFAPDLDGGVRPIGYAGTTVAVLPVAHDVVPFGAIDVTVPVGKRRGVRVERLVVSSADDVANLVRNGIGKGRASVMN